MPQGVIVESIQYQMARGNVPGFQRVFARGRNEAAPNQWVTLGESNTVIECVTPAESFDIVSSDSNDNIVGDGARVVMVAGLDADYNEQTEVVELDGTTLVQTVFDYIWPHTLVVIDAGAQGANIGIVTLSNSMPFLTMPIGFNNSYNAAITVPAGLTFFMDRIFISEVSAKSTEFGVWLKPHNGIWMNLVTERVSNQNVLRPAFTPLPISERSQFQLRTKADRSGAKVTGSIIGWTEPAES